MYVYIPKSLDIDAIIADNSPTFRAFKKDFLLYVIDRILMRSQFKKDKIYFGYVPLLSTYLQEIKPNYKDHMNYLLEQGIVDCNNTYKKNRNPKGYRILKKWGFEVKAVLLTDFTLIKKLKQLREKDENTTKDLKHLTRWFNDGKLKIDSNLANTYLHNHYKYLKGQPQLWEKKRIKGRKELQVKHPAKQFQHGLLCILRLTNEDYYLKRDATSKRLHSNISNMPKILRNTLNYDGRPLYSIDIKNSQPFLSLCLLNQGFWEDIVEGKGTVNDIDLISDAQKSPNTLSFIKISTITKYSTRTKHYTYYTMLGDIVKPLINKDFTKFKKIVSNGTFYEFLKIQFEEITATEITRSEVKELVFLIIFGGNKGGTLEDIQKKKLFKNLFPEVYAVFSAIKRNKKEVLSCLLQTIESYLILDIITKRISTEYPNAPLFSIHDSIATTAEYVDNIEEIMQEELLRAIGYSPTLDRQEWNPETVNNLLREYEAKKNKNSLVCSDPEGVL
jgi:hypothetical protein